MPKLTSMFFFRLVNEQVFQWKALRLLARRSPHFFTHTHQPAVSLPVYLESMVTKLAKEMPVSNQFLSFFFFCLLLYMTLLF